MKTLKTVSANALTDVQVNRISLVRRGANRIPFRLLKGDTDMLDLSRLFKSDLEASRVTAVVVRKGAEGAAKARLTAAGLSVANPEEGDESTIFHQGKNPEAGDIIVKMDEDVGVVVHVAKGFKPYEFQSEGFKQSMKVEGFYPSVTTAFDTLRTVMHRALEKSTSPEDAVGNVAAAIDDFKGYVGKLTSSLPKSAFQLDGLFAPVASSIAKAEGDPEEKDGEEKDGEEETEDSTEEKPAGEEGEEESEEKDETKPDDQGTADKAPIPPNQPTNPETQEAAVAVDPSKKTVPPSAEAGSALPAQPVIKADQMADFRALLAETLTGLTSVITEKTGAIAASVDKVNQRLDGVETRVAKAEKTVRGTVLGDAPEDRLGGLLKSDPAELPLLDTAFMSRN
jgi:hypothetical protein